MNPSSSGWVKKLLQEVKRNNSFLNLKEDAFYSNIRSSGFIYGSNVDIINNVFEKADYTEDEVCKVNLLIIFLYYHSNSNSAVSFVDCIINFYTAINEIKTSFLSGILGGKKSEEQLEKIIHKRIQIDDNLITKNFNYFIINALLYVDVLGYQYFLTHKTISKTYIKNLEASIEAISLNVLNAKSKKNKYDNSLIKLFEASLRFEKNTQIDYKTAISHIKTPQEKHYILDIACMTTWSDRVIDANEQRFLQKLGNDLNLNKEVINQSIYTVNEFYTLNKNNIALLSSKNIVKSFYNNSSKMVTKLISRNSKCLYQELKDSKELVILISQSTVRDLSDEESKKVQEQLLDIFKSIPSLAIFLLPGGALLLPLVVKFIPKLLPSAFNENRIDE